MATAEMGCFLSLGWQLPAYVLDLYVEFKRLTCGRDGEKAYPSLAHALTRLGLDGLDVEEKDRMRELATREGSYTDAERMALLDYCQSDVDALVRMLPAMLRHIDWPRAVIRGRFVKAAAHVEHNGVPVDTATLALLDEHWETLQEDMVAEVDADFGVFEGIHFRAARFARWLARHGIDWPRLATGELNLEDDTFKSMAEVYPALGPLRQVRQHLALLRLTDLPVGRDGRNRCMLSPFGSVTGRCTPSSAGYVFSRPAWMRSLVRPEEGRALAYLDWSAQEYGIGAVLSGDPDMTADYEAGDPYLSFARRIGMVPEGATKDTHAAERGTVKTVILGTQYGMGVRTLAARIGKPEVYARDLLQAHRTTYRKFWAWSDAAVRHALFRGRLWTRFGWQTHVRYRHPRRPGDTDPNAASLANFPCQANGAEMLGLAAGYVCDAGVMLDATVHDAVLVEAAADNLGAAVHAARAAMKRASRAVLGGFELRTDCEAVYWPDHYRDKKGARFWGKLMKALSGRTTVAPSATVVLRPAQRVLHL
jgi:hypothetical protein